MRDISKLAADAKSNMVGFTFTNLASDARGKGDVNEIWRCQRPGTNVSAFDICITKRGAAVFGDIDGLLFQAGCRMAFLAGDSIPRIHEKLEAQCKEAEFDVDRFAALVGRYVSSGIVSAGFVEPQRDLKLDGERALRWWRDRGLNAVDTAGAKYSALDKLQKVRDFVEQAIAHASSTQDACAFLAEHSGDNGLVDVDWRELPLTSPSESLIVRLHMLNLAAKAIVTLDMADDDAPNSPARGARP